MNYTKFKQQAQDHLSKWIRTFHPNIEEGKYKYKNEWVKRSHILPLGDYAEKGRKEAIIAAIKQYNVLTDNVEFNSVALPISELHALGNHLTSSQILCYNFFACCLEVKCRITERFKSLRTLGIG